MRDVGEWASGEEDKGRGEREEEKKAVRGKVGGEVRTISGMHREVGGGEEGVVDDGELACRQRSQRRARPAGTASSSLSGGRVRLPLPSDIMSRKTGTSASA